MSTFPNVAGSSSVIFPLLSDEPSNKDLLSFEAIASTVVNAIFDDDLDPIALGVSGAWGSGKTTVLELIKSRLVTEAASRRTGQILLVSVDPWRFDPLVGPKESLIAAVLSELEGAIKDTDGSGKKALDLVKRLAKRVNWSKAIQMAASTAITLQLPKIEDLTDLINGGEENEADDSVAKPQGMDQFREDFEDLLDSDGLNHISRVVVLVDDLDRCLPPTVVQTLEAIRLFLSAKRMSFVIAADEARVAEAIQHHLKLDSVQRDGEETVAELYLHKIVQTTVPLPALSRVDTQAYLFLLLCRTTVKDDAVYDVLVAKCTHLRHTEGSLDMLEVPTGFDLDEPLAIAARLTPILYEKLRGNPRRIKRFLNDLNVRHTVASHRGITMEPAATAKLMVLERLLKDEFAMVLDWLSRNELRDRLDALQSVATQAEPTPAPEAASDTPETADATQASIFTDELIRWAKLPPLLEASEVSSYLYLAASFSNTQLVAEGLPQRLRDIAANLASSSKVDQQAVTDGDLRALDGADVSKLVDYLARSTRDQPSIQKFTVQSMLRIIDCHPSATDAAIAGLKRIPAKDLKPATVLLFRNRDRATYQPLFEDWLQGNPSASVRTAIEQVSGGR